MTATEWSLRFNVSLHAPRRAPLDVELSSGSPRLAITGPSGAGKSTLLRILAGVETKAIGVIEAGPHTWLHTGRGAFVPPWQRRVGWVPQDALLFPHLDVRANLLYASRPGEGPTLDEVVTLLEVGHLLDRRPRNLSGGERQRVALGRALLSRPQLLLLDEPFAALDRPLRRRLTRTLYELRERWPIPTILVSHDAEDVAELADEAYRLTGGRLVPELWD